MGVAVPCRAVHTSRRVAVWTYLPTHWPVSVYRWTHAPPFFRFSRDTSPSSPPCRPYSVRRKRAVPSGPSGLYGVQAGGCCSAHKLSTHQPNQPTYPKGAKPDDADAGTGQLLPYANEGLDYFSFVATAYNIHEPYTQSAKEGLTPPFPPWLFPHIDKRRSSPLVQPGPN